MHPDTGSTETAAPPSDVGRRMPELGRGTCIGRYVVLDRIGAGGMGVVYRAYDPDLDRRVALKLVRDLAEDAGARLVREAQALAKVSHPNIVAVFDVGTFAGSVFIAMELVEGRTLLQWHRAETRGWREIKDHLVDAARGLSAAHAAGLIHRDFKPNNVIVGADGRVRVLDFGLARVATTPEASPPRDPDPDPGPATMPAKPAAFAVEHETYVTEEDDAAGLPRVVASRVMGTPVYMAPEQRKRGVIDARADQFSFAVAAWELLYGERPFDAKTGEEYAAAAAAGRLRPAPAKTEVPAWVRRVLVRALSPSAGDRYRSMDALIDALEADPGARRWKIAGGIAALALVGVGAVALAERGHAAGPCQDAARHLAGVWDAAARQRLDAAFTATGKGYAADTAARVDAALDLRAKAWVDMHEDACLATRVRGEQSPELLDLRMACLDRRVGEMRALVDELASGPDPDRLASAVDAVARLPEVSACADREALTAAVPPPAEPAARERIAALRSELDAIQAQMWTGSWTAAHARAGSALEAARDLHWSPVLAEASLLVGELDRLTGDLPASEAALYEAVDAAADAHMDEVAAHAWSELVAVVGYEEARPAEGLALAHAAGASATRAGAPPMVREALDEAEALVLSAQGKYDQALERARAALAIVQHEKGDGDIQTAEVTNTIAMLTADRGDYAEAEQLHRKVLAMRQAAFGATHPRVADSIDNLGTVLHHEGKRDEARALYQQALDLRIAALGPEHRDVGTSHNNLGSLLMEEGDDEGATRHLMAALAIYQAALGPDHADLAIPLSNLGELASRRGDHTSALGFCLRALALDTRSHGADDPDLAYDLVCVGEARFGLGDVDGAHTAFDRALTLREASAGDAGELARTRFDLARTLGPSERARAVSLAQAAESTLATLGPTWADRLAAVRTWLAAK